MTELGAVFAGIIIGVILMVMICAVLYKVVPLSRPRLEKNASCSRPLTAGRRALTGLRWPVTMAYRVVELCFPDSAAPTPPSNQQDSGALSRPAVMVAERLNDA